MRKLALASGAFAAGVLLCALLDDNVRYALAVSAVLIAAGVLCALFTRGSKRKVLLILMLSASAGILRFGFYYNSHSAAAAKLEGERRITVKASGYPVQYDDYAKLQCDVVSEGRVRLGAVLYDSSPDSELMKAEPGMIITLDARLSRADRRYGEDYDYLNSVGIFLRGTVRSGIETGNVSDPFSSIPVRLRRFLSNAFEKCFSGRELAFMRSLALGDRSGISSDAALETALSRAGIMHVVAVSGMHISFLVGFIRSVYGNTKRTCLFCIAAVWFFVLMTGSPPSAVRAGFMQSLMLTAPFLSRENDPLTSLMAALLVILLINPFAVESVSLQLSFAAVLGQILFGGRLYDMLSESFPRLGRKQVFRYLAGVVSSSAAVLVFTVPLTAVHFKSVGILAPVTNVLVLWAVPLCFAAGFLSAVLCIIFPGAAAVLGTPASVLSGFVIRVADRVSSFPFASLPAGGNDLTGAWLVCVYTAAFLIWLSGMERRKKVVSACAFTVVSLSLLLAVSTAVPRRYQAVMSVLDVGQGQCIALVSDGSAAMVDCGAVNAMTDAGRKGGEYLLSMGIRRLDCLFLTHLHEDHANGIPVLARLMDVKRILVPEAVAEASPEAFRSVAAAADACGTEVVLVSEDSEYRIGNIIVKLYPPSDDEAGENEMCMFAVCSAGSFDMVITGDAGREQELCFAQKSGIDDAEVLVAGHHGSRYSSGAEFIRTIGADTAVISCGDNSYGHPTGETLDRLKASGYSIYRTDLNGDVSFVID